MQHFQESIYQLIAETSVRLTGDVKKAIDGARQREAKSTASGLALSTIEDNIIKAANHYSPICQDTGMPTFLIHLPAGLNQIRMREEIAAALRQATRDNLLRPNSVDSLSGANSGDNIGPGMPVIHFEQWEKDVVDVRLILKGGGCENKNIQYSLPYELPGLGRAGRDMDGIRKCILDAVYQAQGEGCSPGFIGVGIGGDRTTGYELAKQQLFRDMNDVNPDERLGDLEQYIMERANELGIGTMGFGGKETLLGCKIGMINRLPASFYVSVAYNCWAFRRQGAILDAASGSFKEWIYEAAEPHENDAAPSINGTTAPDSRRVVLHTPLTEAEVRQLKVGDVVILHGLIHTGRDALHHYLMDNESPVDLNGAVIYHCGPVMKQNDNGQWHVKAAGPTTSIREEPYQGTVMKKFGIRAVIGKGGMGVATLQALQEHGGVYLNAIGGAAQYYAECLKKVTGVHFLQEFGIPEAMWHLQCEGLAAVVTMDSHGRSLHEEVRAASFARLAEHKDNRFTKS